MTRPHYSLRIELLDPPTEFDPGRDLEARLEVGKDGLPGESGIFTVDDDLRFVSGHGGRPAGPAIKTEKDGRPFVYIGWYGTKDGERIRFRRLKVPLGGVADLMGEPKIVVGGRDGKGGPARAQAIVIAT